MVRRVCVMCGLCACVVLVTQCVWWNKWCVMTDVLKCCVFLRVMIRCIPIYYVNYCSMDGELVNCYRNKMKIYTQIEYNTKREYK